MEDSNSDVTSIDTVSNCKDIHQTECTKMDDTFCNSLATENEVLDDVFLSNLLSRSPKSECSESICDIEAEDVETSKLSPKTVFKEPCSINYSDKQLMKNQSTNLQSEVADTHIAEASVIVPSKDSKDANKSYRCASNSSSDDDDSTSSSDTSDSDFFQIMIESSAPKKLPAIKTKGELGMDELPPIEDLAITVKQEEMTKVGKIHAVVEKLVVIVAIKETKPLDLDTVLFLSFDKPLGRVFDVFGPVIEPFYCVRFNSIEDIKNKEIAIGADVFFAPEKTDLTSYIFVDELQRQKGSDASWKHNNEPPEEFLDFSDDEEEKAAKRKRLVKNRNRQFNNPEVATKRLALNDASSPPSNFSSHVTSPECSIVYSDRFPRCNPFSSTPSLHSLLSSAVRGSSICSVPPTSPIAFSASQRSLSQQGMLQRPPSPMVFTSFPPPPPPGFGQIALVNQLPPSLSSPSPVHSPFANNIQNIQYPRSQLHVAPQNYFNQRFSVNQSPFVLGNSQIHLNGNNPLYRPSFVPGSSTGFQGPMPVSLQQAGSMPSAWHPIRVPNAYNVPAPILPLNVQIPPQNGPPVMMNAFQSNGVQLQPFVNGDNMPPRFY